MQCIFFTSHTLGTNSIKNCDSVSINFQHQWLVMEFLFFSYFSSIHLFSEVIIVFGHFIGQRVYTEKIWSQVWPAPAPIRKGPQPSSNWQNPCSYQRSTFTYQSSAPCCWFYIKTHWKDAGRRASPTASRTYSGVRISWFLNIKKLSNNRLWKNSFSVWHFLFHI